MDKPMKIGALAAATDTAVETIRYYEKAGLLPAPARTESNYRHYDPRHVQRLSFIRHCRSLDMSLDEVRVLLQAMDAPQSDCGVVNTLLDGHIGHVNARIAQLQVLLSELQRLRQRCQQAQASQACGILAGLHDAVATAAPVSAPALGHLGGVHAA